MFEFDEDGAARPGSYAISVADIIGATKDGDPYVVTHSAVCDECGSWASDLWVVETGMGEGELFAPHRRVKRTTCVVVYTCPEHKDLIAEVLCAEYGNCVNALPDWSLAEKVQQHAKWEWERRAKATGA